MEIYLRQPSQTPLLKQPYSIVGVTSIAVIGGIKAVEIRPGMREFLDANTQRLAEFDLSCPPGFGQPEDSFKISQNRLVKKPTQVEMEQRRRSQGMVT